jgi:hypothetical protein
MPESPSDPRECRRARVAEPVNARPSGGRGLLRWPALLAFAAAACGPSAPRATRPYALASAGAQLVLQPQPAITLTSPDLASDVDVVLVHQEFYGLPWDSFEAGTSPPAEWVAVMDDLAARAQAVGPVFLSLQLVSGPGRRFLADRAVVVNGALSNPSGMTTECYDFSTAPDGASKRAAYVAYVDWMVRRFQPRWVNVAIEMNLFTSCGDGPWNALVEVERADRHRRLPVRSPDGRPHLPRRLHAPLRRGRLPAVGRGRLRLQLLALRHHRHRLAMSGRQPGQRLAHIVY